MGINKVNARKFLIALTSTALIVAMPTSFADSKIAKTAEKAKSICVKTKAVAHKPINVKIPTITTPVKNRTFTFQTNCNWINVGKLFGFITNVIISLNNK